MKKNKLPREVREEVLNAVLQFNEQNNTRYLVRFRNHFAYLDRIEKNSEIKIARLQYLPDNGQWDFAVYKYSNEKYDPNEWMFPGYNLLDGSLEGALKAGMEAYPPSLHLQTRLNFWGCLLALLLLPFQLLIGLFKKLFGR